ncbi:MAG: aminotransferase class III-fold pyridoxal phosphate-dependent enzyme [Jatrophihabitantaceae bacterium]
MTTTTTRAARPPSFAGAGNLIYRSETVPVFTASEGCYLVDDSGRRYLDLEAANGTVPFGYDRSVLREALERCAALPGLPSFCESSLRLTVLERLERLVSERTGVAGRVELDLGGAQAMETALRIVAANRGPGTILVFEGAFHGRSAATSMLSSSPRYREFLAAIGLEVVRLPSPDCERCPHHQPTAGCSPGCVAAVANWGTEVSGVGGRQHARRAVALIVEPVLNVAGMVEPDYALLHAAVRRAREHDALVIVDEIFTGMHRTGPRWGFERSGITPDIVVTGKGLSNGCAAVSMVWGREPLMSPDVYRPGSHSATYVGLPHALGVLDAVLDRWQAWDEVESDIVVLERSLRTVLEQLRAAHTSTIAGIAVMGAAARIRLHGALAGRLRALARDHGPTGALLAATGMAPDVINIHPPLIMGPDQFAEMRQVLDAALTALDDEQEARRQP